MSALPLLDGHAGHHRPPARRRSPLAALLSFLRRGPAEEGRAVPAPPQGTALLTVPDTWTAVVSRDGLTVLVPPVPRHASAERVYCGGRSLGTLPRRRTPDRPPWQTAQFPEVPEMIA